MIYRPLGATGVEVSALGLGGESALYRLNDASIGIILKALDLGVTYFDTAPLYGDGVSEVVYGKVAPHHRDQMFLATKTDQRGYDDAWRQFDASLRRLKVDRVDLLQLHHLNTEEEWNQSLGPDGVGRMLLEAKAQGLTRFIGVTGHSDPKVLMWSITEFPFDVILMALNAGEQHVQSFQQYLLPLARGLGMGVAAMKIFARGILMRDAGLTSREALHYVLSLDGVSTAVVGVMNEGQLEANVDSVNRLAQERPLSKRQRDLMARHVRPFRKEINFYRAKVKDGFPTPETMPSEIL